MATQNLDLEAQEQLDQLKFFWKRYGNLITGTVIAVSLAFLGWQFYQKHQATQAAEAAGVYQSLLQAASAQDSTRVANIWGDLKSKYGGTAYAEQGALLAGAALAGEKSDAAMAALKWEIDQGKQAGYQSLARLRLASLLAQARQWDEASKVLSSGIAPEFAALAADRLGDIYAAQGKSSEAKAAYDKAYKALPEGEDYRRLVEIKRDAASGIVALPPLPAASAAAPASAPAAAPAPALAASAPAAPAQQP
jgi:predicted negative regulator of RcsB-dependent stress response